MSKAVELAAAYTQWEQATLRRPRFVDGHLRAEVSNKGHMELTVTERNGYTIVPAPVAVAFARWILETFE